MVWLIRVLIIGTFSVAGERLFTLADVREEQSTYRNQPLRASTPANQPQPYRAPQSNVSSVPAMSYRPRSQAKTDSNFQCSLNRPEPTYHPIA